MLDSSSGTCSTVDTSHIGGLGTESTFLQEHFKITHIEGTQQGTKNAKEVYITQYGRKFGLESNILQPFRSVYRRGMARWLRQAFDPCVNSEGVMNIKSCVSTVCS